MAVMVLQLLRREIDMPTTKIAKASATEASTASAPTLSGVTGATPDVAQVANNMTLANHLGTFVAGQVASQFANENLVDTIKGQNAITVSVGWG
jgi:hypothetical protein